MTKRPLGAELLLVDATTGGIVWRGSLPSLANELQAGRGLSRPASASSGEPCTGAWARAATLVGPTEHTLRSSLTAVSSYVELADRVLRAGGAPDMPGIAMGHLGQARVALDAATPALGAIRDLRRTLEMAPWRFTARPAVDDA